jgi:zinc transport system substrate-binding protein
MSRDVPKSGFFLLVIITLLLLSPGPLFSGAEDQSMTGGRRLGVFVSILPQVYLVERIGGERIQVEVMVKPGQSPHTFEPTPKQMARLAEAEVYFRIGVEFENALMPRIESTMRELEVVDCRKGIRLRHMEAPLNGAHRDEGEARVEENEEQYREHSGETHHHEQGGTDPHIWLSLRNAVQIAGTMHETLVRLDPEGRATYDRGYRGLVEDLETLDLRIKEILAPVRGEPLFVFHPAFGYFADDYNLKQIAIETGGSEPSARQLTHLIEEAKEKGARVIFVQPQFSRYHAEAIADEIGGTVVPIDPLARDYLENFERMARTVKEALL